MGGSRVLNILCPLPIQVLMMLTRGNGSPIWGGHPWKHGLPHVSVNKLSVRLFASPHMTLYRWSVWAILCSSMFFRRSTFSVRKGPVIRDPDLPKETPNSFPMCMDLGGGT